MNNQKGMTLIELIIVVVIMGVMFILAIPTFTSTSHSKLKAAVRDVATEMQMARMKAIYQNKEHAVVFSDSGSSPFGYKLQIANSASCDTYASCTWTDAHFAVAGYNTSAACASSTLNSNGYFCIEGVTVTHPLLGTPKNIQFNTDGSSSSSSVRFKNPNDSNDRWYVSLNSSTGMVKIVNCGASPIVGDDSSSPICPQSW